MKKVFFPIGVTSALMCVIAIYTVSRSFVNVLIFWFFLFFCVEVALRIFIIGELKFGWKSRVVQKVRQSLEKSKAMAFSSQPYLLYAKVANSEGLYPSNNLGYVGKRSVLLKKPSNTIRIFVIGGSTIENIDPYKGPDSHWPAEMQDLLSRKFTGITIEVVNAGTAGYTSAESFCEFAFRGIELCPDLVLIYHNINDAWSVQMVDYFKSDYSHARLYKTWKLSWLHRLPYINFFIAYQLIRNKIVNGVGISGTLMSQISNLPMKSTQDFDGERVRIFKRNIRNIIAIAQMNHVKPVLMKWEFDRDAVWTPPYLEGCSKDVLSLKLRQYIDANNLALEELAKEYNLPFFDVGPFSSEHFSDKIHFSESGLKEVAARVGNLMYPILDEIAGERGLG